MAIVQQGLDGVGQRYLAGILAALSPLELGAEMADVLIDSMPELARSNDPDFRGGLVLSCQSNLTTLWELLGNPTPPDHITPPPDAIAWAHELVHRGIDLAALLRAYRLGHGLVEKRFDEVSAGIEVPPENRWQVAAHATRFMFAYVDAVCTRLVRDWEAERARWIRGAAAARAEAVGAILEGAQVDATSTSATLRYDVTVEHLAFIVWADAQGSGGDNRSASLEAEAAALAEELGGGAVLTIQIGERVVWGWTHWSGGDQADARRAVVLRDGHRAALGAPAPGIDGMRRSHEDALAARRAAEVTGARPGAVVRYRTAALAALTTVDPAEAVRFTEAELGELAGSDDATARLRATLRVYLEENLSPARTARRLGIHQNTVVYRVKRAEEIMGRGLAAGGLELAVALRLSEGLDSLREAAINQPRGRR